MKLYVVAVIAAILFSSCLKESIADAMLSSNNGGRGGSGTTAILRYKINGTPVNISVKDADNQNPNYYTLGCAKSNGYSLDALSITGEFSFVFYSDSLITGTYNYIGRDGDMYFIRYNGTDEYVHDPLDSMSITIAKYDKGHISGYFSGKLTPLVASSTINNIYGAGGSVLITDGSFQNIPVFY